MQVGALFGKYRLERLIGRDVMGEVWAAVDTSSRQSVVLRALPPEAADDDQYEDRFEREAEIASRISDPIVVPLFDHGRVGNRLFRVSPPVDGTILSRRLLSTGPMSPQQAVDVVAQAGSGLQAVHDAGLTDQEVTSANIIVRDNGQVLLSEIGLPNPAGNASGVYGLTTVLYECLTGTAFPSSSGEPPRPSAAVPGVPAEFDAVVARGTAPSPVERYRSVSEFVIAASDAAGVSRRMRAASGPAGSAAIAAAARNRNVLIGVGAAAAVVLIAVVGGVLLGSGASSEVADVVGSSASPTGAPPTTTARNSSAVTTSRAAATTEPEAAQTVPAPDTGDQQYLTSVPAATPPPTTVQSPAASAPNVFPCDPGYVHTPPPNGPCWAPNAGSPPPGQPPAPPPPVGQAPFSPPGQPIVPPPVPQPPASPEILPCYPGYVHTPPPDGPCWAPG